MVPELVSVMGTPTSQCSPPTGHGPCQDADPQPDGEPGGGGWAEGLCRTLACTLQNRQTRGKQRPTTLQSVSAHAGAVLVHWG